VIFGATRQNQAFAARIKPTFFNQLLFEIQFRAAKRNDEPGGFSLIAPWRRDTMTGVLLKPRLLAKAQIEFSASRTDE
jgi:hypothetical protein